MAFWHMYNASLYFKMGGVLQQEYQSNLVGHLIEICNSKDMFLNKEMRKEYVDLVDRLNGKYYLNYRCEFSFIVGVKQQGNYRYWGILESFCRHHGLPFYQRIEPRDTSELGSCIMWLPSEARPLLCDLAYNGSVWVHAFTNEAYYRMGRGGRETFLNKMSISWLIDKLSIGHHVGNFMIEKNISIAE